jgi:DNA-binding transcriptional ArsR family regulator
MESKQAVLGFSALAQETRLDLMRLLAARGPSGMAAGELAAALSRHRPCPSIWPHSSRLNSSNRRGADVT